MRKKRVLIVGEFSQLSTGFSGYGNVLLRELYKSDKYELAEFGCIPDPYAWITMADGSYRPISMIREGDEVITHHGRSRKVTAISQRWVESDIYQINREIMGGLSLRATPNHPVLIIKKSNAINIHGDKNSNPTLEWCPIEDVSVGDYVAYTFPIEKNNNGYVEAAGMKIPLNEETGLLFGWFLAEGFVGKDKKYGFNHVGLCANKTEYNILEQIVKIIDKYFYIKANICERDSVYEIKIVNKQFASFFLEVLGCQSRDKRIHPQLLNGNDSFISSLLSAYFEGDGYISRNNFNAKTMSEVLAHNIVQLCYKVNIQASLNFKNGEYLISTNGKDAQQIESKTFNKKSSFNDTTRTESIKINNLLFTKITNIHKYSHSGYVYNFTVEEDESYVCNNYVVHNCYIHKLHPLVGTVPWKVYPNDPDPHNQEEVKLYRSNRFNQFGRWRFEEVLLDFKPDYVLSWRDPWFDSFINESPYRKNFKFITMPTCDGEPQKQEWLDQYTDADILLTYSMWAKGVLERQSGNRLRVFGVASPPPELDVFKPVEDKAALRTKYGLEKDLFIVNMTARNQPRKLFPDLMKAFGRYLSLCKENGNDELAARSYLYLHTTIVDVGWDIPEEIRRHKLSHKVLLTYMCDNCKSASPCFYVGENPVCWSCKSANRRSPHTSSGVSRQQLADLLALCDVCMHFSVAAGWEMPLGEAKACGIPIMSMDYSAMGEQVYTPGGIPVKAAKMFQEPINATEQIRALPDNDDAARKLYDFAILSKEKQREIGLAGRKHIEDNYTAEKMAKVWTDAIESVVVPEHDLTWLSPPKFIHPDNKLPDNLNNEQFLSWAYGSFLRKPEKIHTMEFRKLLNTLNTGFEPTVDEAGNPAQIQVDRQKIINHMMNQINHHNTLEQYRFQNLVMGVQNNKQDSWLFKEI